jgi:hypothetical protein
VVRPRHQDHVPFRLSSAFKPLDFVAEEVPAFLGFIDNPCKADSRQLQVQAGEIGRMNSETNWQRSIMPEMFGAIRKVKKRPYSSFRQKSFDVPQDPGVLEGLAERAGIQGFQEVLDPGSCPPSRVGATLGGFAGVTAS